MGTDSPEENKPTTPVKFDKLHESLRESSARLSRSLLTFVLALLYLLITVAATTDLQLLLPDSRVKLPILGVDLPLFGFFIVAPALVLVLHFSFLLHLLHHVEKLKAWDKAASDEQKVLIPSFILNYTHSLMQLRHHKLMRALQVVILVLSPLLLLLYMQLCFADYHSVPMTAWHFVVISLDIIVLYVYWVRETPLDFRNRAVISFSKILSGNFKTGIKSLKQIWRETSVTYKLMFVPVICFSTTCLILVTLITCDFFDEHRWFIPRLEVTGERLVKSPPSDVIIHAYLTRGLSADSAWVDHAKGIDLRGRDLRFADLSRCNLLNGLLQDVRLNGANLWDAMLNGANLNSAKLNGVHLWDAELNGANLSYAELNGADLSYAMLNGADLRQAELNGAYLDSAQLNGADLTMAELNGASLDSAKLNGACLRFAKLNGATLRGAELNGAELREVELVGADLHQTEFNGADLSSATLNGAYAYSARFSGADLRDAKLNCAILSRAIFSGAYLEGTEFGACKYSVIPNFDQVYFRSTTLPTPVLEWDSLRADTMKIPKGELRQSYLDRVALAEVLFDSTRNELGNLRADSAGFVDARKQLACENTWAAQGLQQQIGNFPFWEQSREWLLGHMYSHCPDSLEIIRNRVRAGTGWWNAWLRDQIDTFLRERAAREDP